MRASHRTALLLVRLGSLLAGAVAHGAPRATTTARASSARPTTRSSRSSRSAWWSSSRRVIVDRHRRAWRSARTAQSRSSAAAPAGPRLLRLFATAAWRKILAATALPLAQDAARRPHRRSRVYLQAMSDQVIRARRRRGGPDDRPARSAATRWTGPTAELLTDGYRASRPTTTPACWSSPAPAAWRSARAPT